MNNGNLALKETNEEWVENGYCKLRNKVALDNNLTLKARAIYSILLAYSYGKGQTYVSQETIADKAGCSVKTVQKYLDELVENEYIVKIDRRSVNLTNMYLLNYTVSENNHAKGNSYDHTRAASYKELRDYNNIYNNNKKNNIYNKFNKLNKKNISDNIYNKFIKLFSNTKQPQIDILNNYSNTISDKLISVCLDDVERGGDNLTYFFNRLDMIIKNNITHMAEYNKCFKVRYLKNYRDKKQRQYNTYQHDSGQANDDNIDPMEVSHIQELMFDYKFTNESPYERLNCGGKEAIELLSKLSVQEIEKLIPEHETFRSLYESVIKG